MDKELLKLFNEQINKELYSEYYYISMANYFMKKGLDGFANFFFQQASEERIHAMKFFNFVYERGDEVELFGIDNPPSDFESITDVFEKAYAHEQFVTKLINTLMEKAKDVKDFAAESFLNWFIDEQVEEESTMKGIVDKLKLIKDNVHGIFMLNEQLSQRKAPQIRK